MSQKWSRRTRTSLVRDVPAAVEFFEIAELYALVHIAMNILFCFSGLMFTLIDNDFLSYYTTELE